MTEERRIVGIVLVKNEDLFVTLAIRNVLDFCDEILVLDNFSTDGTWARLEALADEQAKKITLMRIRNAKQSHRLLHPYAGRPVFVFGVDGDELYDPAGLQRMRRKILGGSYDHAWCLYGHVLHATAINLGAGTATGYQTPVARSMTKLYNFGALESWEEPGQQRLHGKNMVFKPGFSTASSVRSFQKKPWAESPLRCLHACFVPRTTQHQDELANNARRNISELHTKRDLGPGWKAMHYAVGDQVTQPLGPFVRPAAERAYLETVLPPREPVEASAA